MQTSAHLLRGLLRDRLAFGAGDGCLKALYLILQAVPLLAQRFQLCAHPSACRLHQQ